MTAAAWVSRLSCASLVVGCARAPAASETPKPPPEAVVTPRSAADPGARVARSVASFPNGDALVGNPSDCKVSMAPHASGARWNAVLPNCGGVLLVVVAPNSVAYARTAVELVAFSADGARLWANPLGPVPLSLAAPTVTLDSLVVAATAPNALVAFRPDGTPAFSFKLDGEERILAAPHRSDASGLFVVTDAAVYGVGSDGNVVWRNVFGPPSE